jgi:hypothetical protein
MRLPHGVAESRRDIQPPPAKRPRTEYEDDADTLLNAGSDDFGSLGNIAGDIDWPDPGPVLASSIRA